MVTLNEIIKKCAGRYTLKTEGNKYCMMVVTPVQKRLHPCPYLTEEQSKETLGIKYYRCRYNQNVQETK